LVSWACGNLSKRSARKHINPHMLRHWFATDMIRRGVNPEIARRQLRHKNIETTMKIYVQVNDSDLLSSLPVRPQDLANTKPGRMLKPSYLSVVS